MFSIIVILAVCLTKLFIFSLIISTTFPSHQTQEVRFILITIDSP